MPLHRHHRFRQLPRSIKSKLQQPIRSAAITRGRADLIETRPLKQAARTRRSRHRKEEKDPSLHLLGINVYGQLPHTGIRPDKNDQRGSTAKKLRYPVLLPGTNQRSGATLPHTTHHEGAAYLEKNLTACVVRYFLFRVVAFFSRTSLVPLNSKSGTTTTSRHPQRPYENEHTIAYNRNWKHRLCCDPCLNRTINQRKKPNQQSAEQSFPLVHQPPFMRTSLPHPCRRPPPAFPSRSAGSATRATFS